MQRILPYAFHGLDYLYEPQLARFYNLIPAFYTQKLGEGFLNQTTQVYSSLLQSIAEQDKEFLKQILEPKLYHATSHCMDLLEQKQLKLQYVEQDQLENEDKQDQEEEEETQQPQQQFSFFSKKIQKNQSNSSPYHIYQEKDYKCNIDVRGVFGVKINRIENQNTRFFQIPAFPVTPRNYFVNIKNPFGLYENQIIVANILIHTSKKLIAVDEQGKVVHGNSDNNQFQYHKLRLESYVPNFNWVITDIDDYLKGNPYF
ncbi:unnamed protein product (macronuclear) [Paramecium tetraurelia]|uniref:Uncharacterized protein n=1 Tax=Paramecium tetraurelia TaxID=5888 RepID=A0CWB4_PARTE|nr:uncharacterized protein GSPATT00001283001 [Paramecium tetraurelia]CAK75081.1 unnamed protein product [Paramecium tetraurelia]|eukprot:XP_001442478.1 hypothetical protein (macronuclear) [Paramecium tetraurelia strain d4-2]